MEFDSEHRAEEPARRTGGDAATVTDADGLSARVLTLQRQAGNRAVARALGGQGRTLAREAPWSFSPLKPAPPELRPWESPDPAVRARWEQDMRWIANRPSWVKVTVNASGLKDAVQTAVTAPPAQTQPAPAQPPATGPSQAQPAPAQPPATGPSQAQPAASQPAPATVATVATPSPPVKGVQVAVQYGVAAEAHTKQGGPGADPNASQTDWQSSAQVALTVVYHDDDKPGWEWSTQFQMAWSDPTFLRSLSPTALQSVQIGSQVAYVIPLWNNVQAQIFGQVMFGVQADGRPTAQVSGGGQLQLKIGKGFSLFLQGGIGATQGSGSGNAPNYTGDSSVQGGIIYQWP